MDRRKWRQELASTNNGYGPDLSSADPSQRPSGGGGRAPARHRIMSGDMGQMQQPSTRELLVQMDNAKTTIKDLEQVSVPFR